MEFPFGLLLFFFWLLLFCGLGSFLFSIIPHSWLLIFCCFFLLVQCGGFIIWKLLMFLLFCARQLSYTGLGYVMSSNHFSWNICIQTVNIIDPSDSFGIWSIELFMPYPVKLNSFARTFCCTGPSVQDSSPESSFFPPG